MSNVEVLSKGIPSIRGEIKGKSRDFSFELTFQNLANSETFETCKLMVVDSNLKEFKNEITFDTETLKAKFTPLKPFSVNTYYYIVLINEQNKIKKRFLRFYLTVKGRLVFEKIVKPVK